MTYYNTIGIIGCGLIGGSIAQSIHKYNASISIHGIDPLASNIKSHPNATCFNSIETSIQKLPTSCELVFVCTPIPNIVSTLQELSHHLPSSAVLTDVGSIKHDISTQINKLQLPNPIILGHPMAGKEVTGFTAANANLLDKAPYFIISPESKSLDTFRSFITALGCTPIECNTTRHDTIVALSSHLPYLVASALTHTVKKCESTDLTTFTKSIGPGFQDTTRVAGSSFDWGTDICTTNKTAISHHLSALIDELQLIKETIQNNDSTTLKTYLKKSQSIRNTIVP